MKPSFSHSSLYGTALSLALAGLSPHAAAQNCNVAEGQTLVNAGTLVCEGFSLPIIGLIPPFVSGLLHNLAGATLTSHGMTIYQNGTGTAELRTDGTFISRAPDFFNWEKVTIGSTGRFDQTGSWLYSFGAFNNNGLFVNSGLATFGGGGYGRSVLTNTGSLINLGTLDFTRQTQFFFGSINGSSRTFIPGDNATLVNSGVIHNQDGGRMLLNNFYGNLNLTGGRLINQGYLQMDGGLQMGYAAHGTLELRKEGTADFYLLNIANGYQQVNAGLLLVNRLDVAGSLQNDGTITIRGSLGVFDSADIKSPASPRLINNGLLNIGFNDGTSTVRGSLYVGDFSLVRNSGRMLIETGSSVVNQISAFHSAGELTNRGEITNRGGSFEISSGGRFTLDGNLLNDGGQVTFAVGSVTSGSGHYRQQQSYARTRLDGQVDLADFVIAGGRLCGNGVLNGNLVVQGGVVSPGCSPGTLRISGDVEFQGGTLQLEIAGTAAGRYDVLQVDGELSFAPGVVLDIVFVGGYVPQAGDSWTMLRVGSAANGMAGLSLQLSGLPDGYALALDGNGRFAFQTAAIPEPGSALLLLLGLISLQMRRRQVQ